MTTSESKPRNTVPIADDIHVSLNVIVELRVKENLEWKEKQGKMISCSIDDFRKLIRRDTLKEMRACYGWTPQECDYHYIVLTKMIKDYEWQDKIQKTIEVINHEYMHVLLQAEHGQPVSKALDKAPRGQAWNSLIKRLTREGYLGCKPYELPWEKQYRDIRKVCEDVRKR